METGEPELTTADAVRMCSHNSTEKTQKLY